jgi:hypothetical protein
MAGSTRGPTVPPPAPENLNSALQRNIAALERRRRDEAARAGLDERIAAAFARCDDGPALLVGMDTPQLTSALLEQAVAAVAAGQDVLGLANDGGWWALGLHTAAPAAVLALAPAPLLPAAMLPVVLDPLLLLLALLPAVFRDAPLLALVPLPVGIVSWDSVFCVICRLRAAATTSSPAATTL